MNKSLYTVILLLLLSSCTPLNRKKEFNDDLTAKVKEAIAGSDTASTLAVLIDKKIPPASNPNSITQLIFNSSGKRYYAVLAEYPNPIYNRFSIIDTNYHVLLVDKSLNGYLTQSKIELNHLVFIKVEENFISKGEIGLRRISFYSIYENNQADLVFRSFTELHKPDLAYSQDIVQISPKEIVTKIYSTVPGSSNIIQDHDLFSMNEESGKYASAVNVFDNFVRTEVENFESTTNKPEITSREAYLNQIGVITQGIKYPHKLGKFSIPLSGEWNEIKNINISDLLKRPQPGTRFINDHYGAEISVIQIIPDDSAESLISYPLENISAGNYRVRFSEKISNGKFFYQFFEYSCGREKFLLILQTLKTTYEQYKDDYQNLINSFSMEC